MSASESKNERSCYIYTRVSTDMQTDGYSLDVQKERCEQYAKFRELQVAGYYCDEGKSGKTIDGREKFMQMIEDIENKKDHVSSVLVYKLSRFGRSTKDVLNSLETLEDNGVSLISVEEGIDSSNGMGRLFVLLLAAVAEIERENIAVQTYDMPAVSKRRRKDSGTEEKRLMATI